MKRLLYYTFLLAFPMLYAQEVKVETNTKNIKIGEQIQYKVSVETPADTPVSFPEGQTFAPLENGEKLVQLIRCAMAGSTDW